jgi:hypothetical protein
MAKASKLSEVARLAGVSPITASRAIRGTGYVSDAARTRILDAARELNYTPDMLARRMRGEKSKLIGVFLNNYGPVVLHELVRAIGEQARKRDYDLLLFNADRFDSPERAVTCATLGKLCDGLLLVMPTADDGFLDVIERQQLSCALVCFDARQLDMPAIVLENRAGARSAVEHLLGLGHRRIAFIAGTNRTGQSGERQRGYADALAAAGIAVDPALVVDGALQPAGRLRGGRAPAVPARAAQRDLRRQRRNGLRRDRRRRQPRPEGAGRCVGRRLRRHPDLQPCVPAPDHDPPALRGAGRVRGARGGGDDRRPRAGRRAHRLRHRTGGARLDCPIARLNPMAALPPPSARWRAGTLAYGAAGLCALVAWLLVGELGIAVRERWAAPIGLLMLRNYGASDTAVALLLSTLPAIISLLVVPAIGLRSDRSRSRWGRRRPYLMISAPLGAAAMLCVAAAPVLAAATHALLGAWSPGLQALEMAYFCLFWTVFDAAAMTTGALFAGLVADVMPHGLVGRFYALIRIVGLSVAIGFNMTLFALTDAWLAEILLAIALLFGLTIPLMCLMVREGEYPPAHADAIPAGRLALARVQLAQCCAQRRHLWAFAAFMLAAVTFGPSTPSRRAMRSTSA